MSDKDNKRKRESFVDVDELDYEFIILQLLDVATLLKSRGIKEIAKTIDKLIEELQENEKSWDCFGRQVEGIC